MQVVLNVLRQQSGTEPKSATFTLDLPDGSTVLDALNQAKWDQDGTLAFRSNCRNTICGSCAMGINGKAGLACGTRLADLAQTHPGPITITPLGNLPVIRDLVVDMKPFWQGLTSIAPALKPKPQTSDDLGSIEAHRESLQTPENRDALNQVSNCIQCGACYSACNAVTVNPEFPGPHALAKAYRMVTDSRDGGDRLPAYNAIDSGVWGCTRCQQCTSVCPMEVAPMEQISRIKQSLLHDETTATSRAIRHRKTLISLVKEGGWIDERKFGMQVVGNDLAGLASLVPLGFNMLKRGKLPGKFHPSEGAKEVRSLIEAVQAAEAKP
jgi:succinate dehydrogenase / fumarate reductase, iron-sulfur subunit